VIPYIVVIVSCKQYNIIVIISNYCGRRRWRHSRSGTNVPWDNVIRTEGLGGRVADKRFNDLYANTHWYTIIQITRRRTSRRVGPKGFCDRTYCALYDNDIIIVIVISNEKHFDISTRPVWQQRWDLENAMRHRWK